MVGEFDFRHNQAAVLPPINVDLDNELSPWNFVTDLAQPSAARCRPQRRELFRTQPDLAFLARGAPANFESERRSLSFLAQTDMSAAGFVCQITLGDQKAPKTIEPRRQFFDEKLALDFAAVLRVGIHLRLQIKYRSLNLG